MTIKEIVGEENYDVNKIESWFYTDEDRCDYTFGNPMTVFGIDDLCLYIGVIGRKDIIRGLDRIRKEGGELPLFYNDENPKEIDDDLWYEMELCVHQNRNVEMCYWVEGDVTSGYINENPIYVDLSDEEKKPLYEIINSHYIYYFGSGLGKVFADEEDNLKEYNLKEYYENHSEGEAKDA